MSKNPSRANSSAFAPRLAALRGRKVEALRSWTGPASDPSIAPLETGQGGGVKKEGGNEICERVYAWVCMCVRYSAAQRERKVSGNTFQVVRRAA